MRDYEILAQDFSAVDIKDYDTAIWSPRDIVERNADNYRIDEPADQEVISEIIRASDEAQKEAEESGAEFYNGPLIRVRDFEVDNGVLSLNLQNTNYSSHVGTRERPEFSKENRADPLSIGAVLITSDNKIVLGKKSGLVEYGQGEYQLPGAGFVEIPEAQQELYRELNEEVNLEPEHLNSLQPEALIGAVHRQPMLVYNAETGLDSKEVADRWRNQPNEREFSELAFLPEDINAALEGDIDVIIAGPDSSTEREFEGSLRPHAEGALDTFL